MNRFFQHRFTNTYRTRLHCGSLTNSTSIGSGGDDLAALHRFQISGHNGHNIDHVACRRRPRRPRLSALSSLFLTARTTWVLGPHFRHFRSLTKRPKSCQGSHSQAFPRSVSQFSRTKCHNMNQALEKKWTDVHWKRRRNNAGKWIRGIFRWVPRWLWQSCWGTIAHSTF